MSIRILAVLTSLALVGPVFAEKAKIDRAIDKEPVYESKNPKYALLAFGPQSKERVWLVLDGKTLYVDRNGNGDLTDAGEKVAAEKSTRPEDGLTFEVGEVKVGGKAHRGLRVGFAPLSQYAESELGKRDDVKAALAKDAKATVAVVTLDAEVSGVKGAGVGGRVGFMAGPVDLTGVLQFADKLTKAPVVRIGATLQVTFYAERPKLRVGRASEFMLVVGSPGEGPGSFAMILYEGTIPEDVKPVANLSLPGAKKDDPLIETKHELKQRC